MSDTLKIFMVGTLPKHIDTSLHVSLKKFITASKPNTLLKYSSKNMVYALMFLKPI